MSSGDFVLETKGLSKVFNGFRAVDGVDLRVRRGAIHSLIGPNGAGKSTCFNLLTKFLRPTQGHIVFEGEDITSESAVQVARRGMVRSFQLSAVFPQLTVLENVRMGLQRKLGVDLYFWRSDRSLRVLDRQAEELLDRVGLMEQASRLASELPYGQKRALEIAATLALEPRLLLLDEPTAGMGAEDVEWMMQLIRSAAKLRTVLMVEHNMKIVAGISDTITVLARGKVLAEGSYQHVSADPAVIEAYMGGRGTALSTGGE